MSSLDDISDDETAEEISEHYEEYETEEIEVLEESTEEEEDSTEEEELESDTEEVGNNSSGGNRDEYDEQVVESIFDLKEDPKTPEEYERQVRLLIPIVYHGQGVDADAMICRSPVLSELYQYLTRMYWYEKHSGKVVEVEEEEEEDDGENEAHGMSIMELFALRALNGGTQRGGESSGESDGDSDTCEYEESVNSDSEGAEEEITPSRLREYTLDALGVDVVEHVEGSSAELNVSDVELVESITEFEAFQETDDEQPQDFSTVEHCTANSCGSQDQGKRANSLQSMSIHRHEENHPAGSYVEVVSEDSSQTIVEEAEPSENEANYLSKEKEFAVENEEDDYDEQVVESIFDLKEDPKTPEEYETQIRQLIPIVYHDQGVDPDAMINRSPVLAELYVYLKQMYWYEKHSGKVVEVEEEEDGDQEETAEKSMSVMEIFARRALMKQAGETGSESMEDSEEESYATDSSSNIHDAEGRRLQHDSSSSTVTEVVEESDVIFEEEESTCSECDEYEVVEESSSSQSLARSANLLLNIREEVESLQLR